MERINYTNEGLTNNELLLQIWNEKRERRNTNSNLAMYVALGNSQPTVDSIVGGIIAEIQRDPTTAFRWAEDYGRTLVTIHPTKSGCELRSTLDKGSKSFINIETSELLNFKNFIQESTLSGPNVIVLNEGPTTIEGALVSLVHMVDEVIWKRYLDLGGGGNKVFEQATNEILTEGITVTTLSQEEILKLRRSLGPDFPIRLYGSKKINSVPEIIGGVLFNPTVKSERIAVRGGTSSETPLLGKKEIAPEGKVGVFSSITLAKKLHLGHLLLIATADLARLGLGTNKLILINNDTGPRVAAMVAQLAKMRGESLEQTVRLLQKQKVGIDSIIKAYKERDGFVPVLKDNKGLLASMETLATKTLQNSGFGEVEIRAESQFTPTLPVLNKDFERLGFDFSRTDKGIKIIKKAGIRTATGQGLVDILSLLAEFDSTCFVDSSADTYDAVDLAQALGLSAFQLKGSGAGIGQEIGSGTNGTLPTVEDLVSTFGDKLAEIARFFILINPQFSTTHPNDRTSEPFYAFVDRANVYSEFSKAQEKLALFKKDLEEIFVRLNSPVVDEGAKPSQNTALNFLPQALTALQNKTPGDFLQQFGKSTIESDSQGKILSVRSNPYFLLLNKYITMIKTETTTSAQNKLLTEILKFCLEKIGISL